MALEPGLYSVAFAGMMSGAYRVDFLSGYLSGTFITFMALRPGGVYWGEASSWLVLGLYHRGRAIFSKVIFSRLPFWFFP